MAPKKNRRKENDTVKSAGQRIVGKSHKKMIVWQSIDERASKTMYLLNRLMYSLKDKKEKK
jgi:hypothetical protein